MSSHYTTTGSEHSLQKRQDTEHESAVKKD